MACRSLCICFIVCLVIVAAPFAILITLGSVDLEPRFYIQEFYVPALNTSHISNATNLNNSIFIDLKFKRVSAFVPLLFQDLNITLLVFHTSNRSFSVGSYVVPGFYQGDKKTVHRKAVVEALQKVSGGSSADFTVELATKYMLKQCNGGDYCYYTTPKAVVVAADVRVDSSGEKVAQKPIRLR